MKIQIVSDLHLEYRDGQVPYIRRAAPVIGLLGDIGKPFSMAYSRLLANLAHRFDHVIVLAGNHEYYGGTLRKRTMDELRARVISVCARWPNVHFLDNSALTLPDPESPTGKVRILGTTLWTHIPRHLMGHARKKMNDYSMIYLSRVDADWGVVAAPLSPQVTVAWHEQAVDWLKQELRYGPSDPTVVLTHHAPVIRGTSPAVYDQHHLRFCYASDLEYLVLAAPVVAVAFGHTHHYSDQRLGDRQVRVVSNPLGYPTESLPFPVVVLDTTG